jgi:hypothetical protein
MLSGEDPGARRNRGGRGLWLINILISALVAILSLYVFRAEDTRREAQTIVAGVASLPGRVATPAMAAPRED